MELNQQDFFIKYNNKFLDFDGVEGNQCVDVIKAYFTEVLGLPPFKGNAIDYWNNPPIGFKKIAKSWFNSPQPGDILLWDIGQYGHIAVCNWSRMFDVGVFEQNNPLNSKCHFDIHNYANVLGWLRPVKARTMSVCLINSPSDFIKEKINFYAGGHPIFNFIDKTYPILVTEGMLSGDKAMQIIDSVQKADIYLIFYPGNTTSTFAATSYYPAKNCAFATIATPTSTTVPVHEILHCLRKFINFNHLGPYIEDVEKYPTSWSDAANFDNPGWEFESQYNEIKKYF